MNNEAKLLLVVLAVIALIVIGPFLTIWALNTLFPVLAIGYGIDTWAAVILMSMFFRSNVKVKKD